MHALQVNPHIGAPAVRPIHSTMAAFLDGKRVGHTTPWDHNAAWHSTWLGAPARLYERAFYDSRRALA